jgi:predicted RNA-binding protein YlqC (UPF0109 family)
MEVILMQNFVELLAKALVDKPDHVQVKQLEKEKIVVLELKVAEEDMGKIIGKQGRIAKAIRTVVKAAASKAGKRVSLEIVQ